MLRDPLGVYITREPEAEDQRMQKQAEYRQARYLRRHLLNSRRNSTVPANKGEELVQKLAKFKQARLKRKQLLHLRRNTPFAPNPDDQYSSPTRSTQHQNARSKRKRLLQWQRDATSTQNSVPIIQTTNASSSIAGALHQTQWQTDLKTYMCVRVIWSTSLVRGKKRKNQKT